MLAEDYRTCCRGKKKYHYILLLSALIFFFFFKPLNLCFSLWHQQKIWTSICVWLNISACNKKKKNIFLQRRWWQKCCIGMVIFSPFYLQIQEKLSCNKNWENFAKCCNTVCVFMINSLFKGHYAILLDLYQCRDCVNTEGNIIHPNQIKQAAVKLNQ